MIGAGRKWTDEYLSEHFNGDNDDDDAPESHGQCQQVSKSTTGNLDKHCRLNYPISPSIIFLHSIELKNGPCHCWGLLQVLTWIGHLIVGLGMPSMQTK